ncbi:MAG: hypothetical protein HYW57_01555 [Ignavibacteriales bacterium]|nr:hypothetical protein [Ignavibacteriales bacterium]
MNLLATYRKIRIKQILHEDYAAKQSEMRERLSDRKKQVEQMTAEMGPLRETVQRIQSASMMDRLKKGFGKDDLALAQKKLEEKTQAIKRLQSALTALTQESLRIEAHAPISGEEQQQFNLAVKQIEELGGVQKVEEAVEQYTGIDERELLEPYLFIGTTLSNALSDPKLRGKQFDLVMVDDAESIPLPFLIALGTMAKDKMVVSGDPYQLGPESMLGTPDALQWLQRDIFLHVAGTEQLPHLFEFTEKNPQWCILLSSHFASTPKLSLFLGSVIFDDKITVFASPKAKGRIFFIDTSSLRSQAKQYVGRKKIIPHNELHAKKLLELMKHALMEPGRSAKDLGIVVPFAGPGLYIKQQLRIEGIGTIEVGTPHSFRGRRKKAILFDTVMAGVDHTMRPIDDRKVGEHQIVRLLNTVFSCVEEDLYVLADMNHLQSLYKDRLLTRFMMLLKAQADPTVNFAQPAREFDALDWDKKAMLLSPTPEAAATVIKKEEESALKQDAEFAVQMKLIAKKEGAKPETGARNYERETYFSVHKALGMRTDVNLLSQYAGGELLFHHTYSTEQALASLPITPCLSEKEFRGLIEQWDLLLYAMSGGDNAEGPFFKNVAETKIRSDAHVLCRFYSGGGNSDEGKQNRGGVVSKLFQEFLGKPAPGNPQEWHTVYLSLLAKLQRYLMWISEQLRK